MSLVRRSSVVLAATMLIAASLGCKKTPTIPTPTQKTDQITGTLAPSGTNTHTFTVEYSYTYTPGSLKLTSLTVAATGAAASTTIGMGFGSIAFDGSCSRDPSSTAATAVVGQEYNTGYIFTASNYCVSVFDAGTLASVGAVNYAITITHY